MELVLFIAIAIFIFILYHKVFQVAYFGLGAFITEIAIIFIISLLICTKIFNQRRNGVSKMEWWKPFVKEFELFIEKIISKLRLK